MDWIMLITAGMLEIVGVIGIKRASQRDTLVNNVIAIGAFLISLQLLRTAMETISLATAYAVWTGIGSAGATIIGILFFREPKHILRLLCIAGIAACVIGLRIFD